MNGIIWLLKLIIKIKADLYIQEVRSIHDRIMIELQLWQLAGGDGVRDFNITGWM